MVVEAGVARLPPCVQPALGVVVAPEELEGPGAAAVERREVDELGRSAGQSGTFVRGEIVLAGRESLEAGRVDHRLILISHRAIVQDRLVSRIARVEAWPVNVPLEATYLMASGVVPGISRTVLRVTTDDGVVGLGEATSPTDAASLNGELGQRLVGRETAELLAELGGIEPPPVEHRSDAKVLDPQSARRRRDRSLGHRGEGAERPAARAARRRCSDTASSSASTSPTGRGWRTLRPTWPRSARGWSRSTTRPSSRARSPSTRSRRTWGSCGR